ncbi:MAG: DUF192 domain-containing protein [Desulfobacca sp.]|uniref:DUF192 domain-containing protein n=1 Tax=Desulfobacca sp. TaxID=2067990 RepID=UPI004049DAF6
MATMDRRWLCLAIWFLLAGQGHTLPPAALSPAGNPVATVRLGETVLQVEVVSSPEKLYLGLGGRRHLPWGTGMLFILPQRQVQIFCMRGMLIPIDIVWLDQHRVIGFHENLQPLDAGSFSSPGPATLVLEVPAGFVAATGLRRGTELVWEK